MTCNIHIDRKFQDSSVISLQNKENKKIIKTHLNVWFCAKTTLFLHLMLHYSLKYISDHLKEDKCVKKITKVYVKDGWDCWHVTASKMFGVVSNNQGIENYNQSGIKKY